LEVSEVAPAVPNVHSPVRERWVNIWVRLNLAGFFIQKIMTNCKIRIRPYWTVD